MKFEIITIFQHIFDSYFNESIIKRGQKNGLLKIQVHDLRTYTKDKHRKVDDKPFGGGPGMVMQIEPITRAIVKIGNQKLRPLVLITSATGKQFNAPLAVKYSKEKQIIIIAGHYEGMDYRIKKVFKDLGFRVAEISIGPYVLTGGELPAMILVDSIARHIPGVLGKSESLEESRYGAGIPTYTRPETFQYKGKKYIVPKVLLSGNHKKIDEWRKSRSS